MEFEEPSDESLVLKCQSGNGQFFGQLYERYFKKIYSFIYSRTYQKQITQDLTSQVFYKALENLYSFNHSKGRFSTWVFQIARNCLIDFYRTRHQAEDIESVWDLASTASVERDADVALAFEKLGKYLQTLEKIPREILLMRLWDGLSYKEIAQILKLGESNCKMTFSRTLAKLQKELPLAALLIALVKIIL